MSLDITVKVGEAFIEPALSYGHRTALNVTLNDAELADCVDIDDIVKEFGIDELLAAIGEVSVTHWLEEQGYAVNDGGAA